MPFTSDFLNAAVETIDQLDHGVIEKLVDALYRLRENRRRLFILGVGGNAADATHAVADFRKLCGIEAYSATDNISGVTALTNDEGWDTTFHHYLRDSNVRPDDMVMVLSVSGGSDRTSVNIKRAVEYAKLVGAAVVGIVGPHGGYTRERAAICLCVPAEDPNTITSLTHSIQALVLHLLFNHPRLCLT